MELKKFFEEKFGLVWTKKSLFLTRIPLNSGKIQNGSTISIINGDRYSFILTQNFEDMIKIHNFYQNLEISKWIFERNCGVQESGLDEGENSKICIFV